MARYGPQFGPDITFLGVARCDWADPAAFPGADVVILGAPFDGGTSYRSGARFGPQYIRQTCNLPHDGSRPSLALRADGLTDLRVYDAGDVEMFSGDAARSVRDLQAAVHAVARAGAIPLILGGDHTITWPEAAGVAQHAGAGRGWMAGDLVAGRFRRSRAGNRRGRISRGEPPESRRTGWRGHGDS